MILALLCSFIGMSSLFLVSLQVSYMIFDITRNKHIMIDLGTGNNNKMCVSFSLLRKRLNAPLTLDVSFLFYLISYSNWAMDNKQEVKTLFVPETL